jgi:hypothetical protein
VLELVDNGGHGGEDLGLARLRHILLLVEEHGVQEWRDEILDNHVRIG